MKKVYGTIFTMLFVIVVGIFLINEKKENTDVTEKRTKVGAIFIGECDDKSYNQAHYEALEKTAQVLNLDITYVENVPEEETCKPIIEGLIAEGCEIVIGTSFGFGPWMIQAAEEYPEVSFFHASGIKQRKNLATYFGRMYQMRYLSGIVAGMQTETDAIGYVAAFPISEVNRGINAFTLGVRAVNPDATVYVRWCDSWTEDEGAEVAAKELLEVHEIDVIAMHTDSLKVLELAEERGIWSIGYNIDNSEKFPNTFLTAPVWRWENYYEPYILKCLQEKFSGNSYWGDASEGVVGLAPLTANVKPGTEAVVEKAKERMETGVYDVFNGPIVDNAGAFRIDQGENMPDDVMLNRFNWYVEGVVICDE